MQAFPTNPAPPRLPPRWAACAPLLLSPCPTSAAASVDGLRPPFAFALPHLGCRLGGRLAPPFAFALPHLGCRLGGRLAPPLLLSPCPTSAAASVDGLRLSCLSALPHLGCRLGGRLATPFCFRLAPPRLPPRWSACAV